MEPYRKRRMVFWKKDKNGKFISEVRTPNFKERLIHLGHNILGVIIYPFYWGYVYLRRFFSWLFWERIRTGDNGIIGPGFHSYYTTKFAWGKLAFFMVILFIIGFLILQTL